MITTYSIPVFKKTLLVTTVSCLCLGSSAVFAQAGNSIPNSPFAPVPLHLQQTTVTTSGNQPKPNVMLFIDDSGSMNDPSGIDARTKMQVTRDVFTTVINEFGDDFNWGLHTLRQFRGDSPFMDANQVNNRIQRMQGGGNTPAVKEYVDALTQTMQAIEYRCQKNYVIMMSDGDANGVFNPSFRPLIDPGANASPVDTEFHGFAQYFDDHNATMPRIDWSGTPRLGSFFRQTFCPNNLAPISQLSYCNNSALPGAGMSYYSTIAANHDFKTNADGVDAEGVGWDDDPTYQEQLVETYTIGFGGGISPLGTQFLQNGAQPDAGNYYPATSEEELLAGLRGALSNAQSSVGNNAGQQTVSTSTPASTGSSIPELSAYLSLDTIIWGSMLVFNKYAADGITLLPGKSYPSFADQRLVMIHDGNDTKFLNGNNPPPKEFFGIATEQELELGLIPWLSRDLNQSDETIENTVASNVAAADRTVQTYRSRANSATDLARMMGDVMGSPILAMVRDETTNRDGYLVTAANDGMVYIFKDTHSDVNHPFKLIANFIPGAIPREDQSGTDASGNVVAANDTIAKALKATAEEGYGQSPDNPHLFLNNGGIVYRTTPETYIPASGSTPATRTQKQTFIVGATGQGGRGVYALNIGGMDRISNTPIAFDAYNGSNQNTLLAQVPLWVSKEEADNKLGYTVGTPQIGQIATEWTNDRPNVEEKVRLYAFLGNGYPINPVNNITPRPDLEDKPTLYVYEALGQEMGTNGPEANGDSAGTLVTKVPVPDASNLASASLASPTLVDSDFDGIVDTAYAGDYDGNLYRFDLSGSPNDWANQVKLIYKGTQLSTNNGNIYSQPITAAPATYRVSSDKYIVIFGTGSDLYQHDLDNTNQQSLIGIYDDLSDANPTAISRSDLLNQSIYETASDLRYVTNNPIDLTQHKGWVLNLSSGTGERIVVKPQLITSSALFTTRSYSASSSTDGSLGDNDFSCSTVTEVTTTDGESWLMGVDVRTGGAMNIFDGAFFENYIREQNGDYEAAAGIKLVGTSSGVNVHSSSYTYNLNAMTPNGDAGGSGLGMALSQGGGSSGPLDPETRNDCMPVADYTAQVLDQSSTALNSFTLSAKLCSDKGMYRLNERDVPL